MFNNNSLIADWKNRPKKEKLNFSKLRLMSSEQKLNTLASDIHSKIFQRINCLDCANCCKCLPPIINETDCKRIAKGLGIKVTDFKLKYTIYDEDDDLVLKTVPCIFLMPDNKCSIYEIRPKSCREYPHTDEGQFVKNINLHKTNLIYCPAVYFILKKLGV